MSKPVNWTDAQLAALGAADRELLVAASAGTGKTAVLGGYCLERIRDAKNPVDIDRLLVLTFTDAAAEEMRSRIEQMLRRACAESGSARLKRQLLLLDGAPISTIHSFCKRIIAEHFYLLGLDAGFGILDTDQQRLVKTAVLKETIEQAWDMAELAGPMRELFAGRNARLGSRGFADRIIGLSEYLDSVAARGQFYQRAAALADITDAAGGELAAEQADVLKEKLIACRLRLEYAARLDRLLTQGTYRAGYIDETLIPIVENCLSLIEQNRLDECGDFLRQADFGESPNSRGIDKDIAERIKEPMDAARKRLKELAALLVINPEYQKLLAPSASRQTRTMLKLLEMFDRGYEKEKRRLRLLDFADLERLMLELLKNHPQVATGLQKRFDRILVDEYQDINAVQQEILEKLRRRDNMFLVGDVKQSIYAFRGSRPEIFLAALDGAAEDPAQKDKPLRIDLADNFRSRPEVINFVNFLFSRIMRPSSGGVEYDRRARLKAAFTYQPLGQNDRAVELYWLNEDSPRQDDQDDEGQQQDNDREDESVSTEVTAVQRQAAFVANRIRQMVGTETGKAEFQIYDKRQNEYRDVQYRDIVILMRSLSRRANDYVQLLRLAGIPVSSQTACGYLAATEITDMLSLLKVLDNPLRDIEFAGLLRSALFGFTDTELAAVATNDKDSQSSPKFFYEIFCDYARNGHDGKLSEKCRQALAVLSQWRFDAMRGSLSELIGRILREKNLPAIVSALPNGPQRRANLQKLHDRAIQFERCAGFGGSLRLGRFVEFLEQMIDSEQDWAPAQPDSSVENSVRIMSVHKSKGLEFPVVFLATLDAGFNLRSASGQCLINEQTLGLEIIDPDRSVRLATLAHQLISEKQKRIDRDEEMRILYVASTRARERLILTGSQKRKKCLSILRRCRDVPQIADWDIREAGSYFEWILYALGSIDGFARLFEDGREDSFRDELFAARRVDLDELENLSKQILQQKRIRTGPRPVGCGPIRPGSVALLEELRKAINWQYPYSDLTQISAKISVTELTHNDDEFAPSAGSGLDAIPAVVEGDGKGPKRTAALRTGSAVHLVFERLDLNADLNEQSVRGTIETLVGQGLISPATAKMINVEDILTFFGTEPGKLVLQNPKQTLREWPFTLALDARRLGAQNSEPVVVQGIVDLITPARNGLAVVDFKTGHPGGPGRDERIGQYGRQLAFYCEAVEAILGKPVTCAWLYLTSTREIMAVNPQNLQGHRQ